MRAVFAILLAMFFATSSKADENANSIIGVWKQTSAFEKDVASGETEPVQKSEVQSGYRIFTREGRAFIFNLYKPRKPASAGASDADLAALFRTMSVLTGTFAVERNLVTISVDESWIEAWNGTKRTFEFDRKGDTLTMTVGPTRNAYTGREILLISTLIRVENF